MTKPDIQLQLKYHSLAIDAARRWKTLSDAGNKKEADKVAREALKWEKLWQKYGGKGPIT